MKKFYHTLAIAAVAAVSMFSVQSANAKNVVFVDGDDTYCFDEDELREAIEYYEKMNAEPKPIDPNDPFLVELRRYFFKGFLEGLKGEKLSQDQVHFFMDKGKSLGLTVEEMIPYFE